MRGTNSFPLPLIKKNIMKLLSKNYKENRTFYTSCLPNLVEVENNDDIELYKYTTRGGSPAFICFRGKQSKPSAHSCYFTEGQRDLAVKQAVEAVATFKARKAEQRAERKAKSQEPHGVQVGDIFSSSWGYDQTNVNFFQVTKLVGKQSVEIREIGGSREADYFTADKVTGIKDSFLERSILGNYQNNDPVVKRINTSYGLSLNICSSFNAYPWDGKPQHATASGYGH